MSTRRLPVALALVSASVLVPSLALADETPMLPYAVTLPEPARAAPLEPSTRMRSPGLVGGGIAVVAGGLFSVPVGLGMAGFGAFLGIQCHSSCAGDQVIAATGFTTAASGIGTVVLGVWMIARGARRVPVDERLAPTRAAFSPYVTPKGIAFRF